MSTAYLLALTTAHESRLGTRNVYVSPHLVFLRVGRCLGLLDGNIDLGLGLLVKFL